MTVLFRLLKMVVITGEKFQAFPEFLVELMLMNLLLQSIMKMLFTQHSIIISMVILGPTFIKALIREERGVQ